MFLFVRVLLCLFGVLCVGVIVCVCLFRCLLVRSFVCLCVLVCLLVFRLSVCCFVVLRAWLFVVCKFEWLSFFLFF